MKIINEKGRLFGIINIIDLCILLVVVLLIGAVGYKFLGNGLKSSGSQTSTVVIGVKCRSTTEAVAKSFTVGEKALSGDDYVDAFIDSVSYAPAEVTATTSEGKLLAAKDPIRKDLYVTMKAKLNMKSPVVKLGTQEVRIGRSFTVKTQEAEVTGTIESIQVQ